jgi:ketosteroid isomerase-like protein
MFPAALSCLLQVSAAQPGAPAAVTAYHQALLRLDAAALKALFHPDLLVFEAGGVDRGREDYLQKHLGPELKELERWDLGEPRTEWIGQGPLVVAARSFDYTATLKTGKVRRGRATETLVLQQVPEGWRIRHLHWSSHARKEP